MQAITKSHGHAAPICITRTFYRLPHSSPIGQHDPEVQWRANGIITGIRGATRQYLQIFWIAIDLMEKLCCRAGNGGDLIDGTWSARFIDESLTYNIDGIKIRKKLEYSAQVAIIIETVGFVPCRNLWHLAEENSDFNIILINLCDLT